MPDDQCNACELKTILYAVVVLESLASSALLSLGIRAEYFTSRDPMAPTRLPTSRRVLFSFLLRIPGYIVLFNRVRLSIFILLERSANILLHSKTHSEHECHDRPYVLRGAQLSTAYVKDMGARARADVVYVAHRSTRSVTRSTYRSLLMSTITSAARISSVPSANCP